MNHKPYLDSMNTALDGELSSIRRRELVEHLTACASCQATWDALNDVQRQLKTEPLAEPRSGFVGRFKARQADEAASRRMGARQTPCRQRDHLDRFGNDDRPGKMHHRADPLFD